MPKIIFLGTHVRITNQDLLLTWKNSMSCDKEHAVFQKLLTFFGDIECSESFQKKIKEAAHIYCLKINERYRKCQRKYDRFCSENQVWLNKQFYLPHTVASDQLELGSPSTSRGRPVKPFQECGHKAKKIRVAELVSSHSYEELHFAAEESARISGLNAKTSIKQSKAFSVEKSLALILDLDLSNRRYTILRENVNALHNNCFPSLYKIKQLQSDILPKKIIVNEYMCAVDLQELLNITSFGILKLLDFSLLQENAKLKLTYKYGFDGSSGHSTYKQKFQDETLTDEYFFLIALSPLKLIDQNSNKTLWCNPRPSSTFFCRPIKFLFLKENASLVKEEEKELETNISNLKDFILNFKGVELCINYDMILSMLDGSTVNILSDTNSTQKCVICGASPKEMNSFEVYKKTIKPDNLRFGISSLHLWIRTFECLLHIAYRLPIKCWQVRTKENKLIFEETKKRIQSEFKKQMGLTVDKPKPGFGSTNDGNTSRTFFKNASLSSSITGIDENLIIKFHKIIRIVNCGQNIKLEKFSNLLKETFQLYLELYSWFYMPSSIHKLLVHGVDIIKNFDVPIGQLGEDALEARHKEVRKLRLHHTRKSSRENTNRDLMTSLLLTSDPYLASLRKTTTTKTKTGDINEYLIFDNHNSDSDQDLINIEGLDLNLSDEDID